MNAADRQIRFWRTVRDVAFCALLGLAVGVCAYLGWLADLPPWLR